MSNPIQIIRQGESLPFSFDLDGDSIDGWVCTINVRTYPSEAVVLTRVVPATDTLTWTGFLTSTETAALSEGTYRLTGVLTNATLNKEQQEVSRFTVSKAWG